MSSRVPRLMIAAAGSGSGKTTVTCGILGALSARGLTLSSFKAGPDYVDPLFHREALGVVSYNLDLFFSGEAGVRSQLEHFAQGADLGLIEGVMGFYDGLGGTTTESSSWQLATAVEAPVVLVINPKGMSLSVIALLQGFLNFRPNSRISGVIFNHCSPHIYQLLAPLVTKETGLPVFGYLPWNPQFVIPSRQLGLITPQEEQSVRSVLERLARQAEETLDLEGLLTLAKSAPPMESLWEQPRPVTQQQPVIAVARDNAFCFYYPENLALLEALGAKLEFFSPLEEEQLPAGTAGLYLGGGYAQNYAKQLSQNKKILSQIRQVFQRGIPTMAEDSGFLYLHQQLEGEDGTSYPMVGVVEGRGYATPKLQRFGYLELTLKAPNSFYPKGLAFPAHSFHYWESTNPGSDARAQKPISGKNWDTIHCHKNFLGGFPHLYLPAAPEIGENFIKLATEWRNTNDRAGS